MYEERYAIRRAARLDLGTVRRIDTMHRVWLLDSEIAEVLGLSALVVWHARQLHGINRHKPPKRFRSQFGEVIAYEIKAGKASSKARRTP